MYLKYSIPHATQHAQDLRKRTTPAETLLWSAVRNRKFHGLKFRRQVPIGRFIVDFLCTDPQLILELDGPIHDFKTEKDAERTEEIFHETKMRVLRLKNEDVLEHLTETLQKLEQILLPPHPLASSPATAWEKGDSQY